MTSNNSKKQSDWGATPVLTPEQIILWLEGHREMMMEIWRSNPGTREIWEKNNQTYPSKQKKDDPSSDKKS